MVANEPTINEVDFCGQIASESNVLIRQDPAAFVPLHEARIEGYGTGRGRRKRKDLRFYGRDGRIVLCGEVKMPGTREGQSAISEKLVRDAAEKAENVPGPPVQFFFTWNVNDFALWDRSRWREPWFDRRVNVWPLARTLLSARDVAREDNLRFIKTQFLPDLLRDLGDILSGRRRDWTQPPDELFIQSLNRQLSWPCQRVSAFILDHSRRDKAFDRRVQRWMGAQGLGFLRKPHEEWVKAVDNMANTLVYVRRVEKVLAGLAIGGSLEAKAEGGPRPEAIREIPDNIVCPSKETRRSEHARFRDPRPRPRASS